MKTFFTVVLLAVFFAGSSYAQRGYMDPNIPVLRRAGWTSDERGDRPYQQRRASVPQDSTAEETRVVELPAAPAPPAFGSFAEALTFLRASRQPVSVSRVRPHDPYREDGYGRQFGYGGYSRIGFPGRYGYGGYGGVLFGGYDFPVHSDVDPSATLGRVLQTQLTQSFKSWGLNVVAPATGSGASDLDLLDVEARTGKNSGIWGNHTWESARYVITASYAVKDEDVQTRGFDGTGPAIAAQQIGWRLGNQTTRDVVTIGAEVLSQVQVLRQRRKVMMALYVSILDAKTRQILYAAEGTGALDAREISVTSVAGVYRVGMRHPNAELLARQMVNATIPAAPAPTQQEQELAGLRAQLGQAEADARHWEERAQIQTRIREAQKRVSEAKQKAQP